ncbi:TPA: hypothetical protein ACF2UJ_000628 [Escherichia coli]
MYIFRIHLDGNKKA